MTHVSNVTTPRLKLYCCHRSAFRWPGDLFGCSLRVRGRMLRVEMLDSADSLNLRLEGRFTAEDAVQTRTLLSRCGAGTKLIVDLTEVVFIDAVGEEVLSFFGRFGAQFVAPTSYTLDVCERLQLPLALTGTSQANSLRNFSTGNGQSRPDAADSQKKGL